MTHEYPSPWLDPHYPYNHHGHHDHHHCDTHRIAPECDDQLPVFSTVGRGIKGDTYRVKVVDPDTHEITQLVGETYDEATKTWHTEWMSENINGGHLEYQYHLRPYNVPSTFTITFKYHRPSAHGWTLDENGKKVPTSRTHHDSNTFCCDGEPNDSYDSEGNRIENNVGDDPDNECSWVWTTPAIPYFWTPVNEDGSIENPPDHIVGSGVGTLFTRTMHDNNGNPLTDAAVNWTEQLIYPKGWTREHFNAPTVLKPWTVNLRFGFGGNVNVPDFYDISKIIGVPIRNIINLLNGQPNQITDGTMSGDSVVDYVKNWIDHIHTDLGFNGGLIGDSPGAKVPNSNNPATVENYIKASKSEVKAGRDIEVTESYGPNGQKIYTVSTDLADSIPEMPEIPKPTEVKAGPGIKVTKNGNVYTVEAMSASPGTLIGKENLDFTMLNGWEVTAEQGGGQNFPEVYLNLSTDGSEIVGGSIQFDFYNKAVLSHPGVMVQTDANKNTITKGSLNATESANNGVYVAHAYPLDTIKSAAICAFSFKGSNEAFGNEINLADLNSKGIMTQSSTCLWNFSAQTGSESCAWPVFVEIRKASSSSTYGGAYVLYVTMLGDGINSQFSRLAAKWLSDADCKIPYRANTRVAGLFGSTQTTANV